MISNQRTAVIIYLEDVAEDLATLNRRTNLPIRIVQDRPQHQKETLLWKELKEEQEAYEETETYAIKTTTGK